MGEKDTRQVEQDVETELEKLINNGAREYHGIFAIDEKFDQERFDDEFSDLLAQITELMYEKELIILRLNSH